MPVPTAAMPVAELSFDPHNPRLWDYPHTHDQVSLASQIAEASALQDVCASYANGLYTSHEPFLAYQKDQATIVVDGNARLLALKLLTDPAYCAAVGLRATSEAHPDVARELRRVPVALYPSWDDIHPIRVHRQRMNHCSWDTYTSAQDYRRLSRKGLTFDRIAEIYNLQVDVVANRITTLAVFDQLREYLPEMPRPRPHFNSLAIALTEEAILAELGIDAKSDHTDTPPLSPEGLKAAGELMSFLSGCPPNRFSAAGHQIIHHPAQARELGRIYARPKMLAKLRRFPAHSLIEILDEINGYHYQRNVHDTVQSIHQAAIAELGELKSDSPELVSYPTMIHVAATRHSYYNDRNFDYIVELSSKVPGNHEHIPDIIREKLNQRGYHCQVTLD